MIEGVGGKEPNYPNIIKVKHLIFDWQARETCWFFLDINALLEFFLIVPLYKIKPLKFILNYIKDFIQTIKILRITTTAQIYPHVNSVAEKIKRWKLQDHKVVIINCIIFSQITTNSTDTTRTVCLLSLQLWEQL